MKRCSTWADIEEIQNTAKMIYHYILNQNG